MIPAGAPAGLELLLRGLPPVDEVIVVGAGLDLSSRPGAVLVPPTRPGQGNAIACGVRAAHGDIVVTLNGDGSTDPAEIPRFVRSLTAGADVALGSRYSAGGRDLTGGRLRRWADLLLIWFCNAVLGIRRTDPGFGYAAFWRDAVPSLGLADPAFPGPTSLRSASSGSASPRSASSGSALPRSHAAGSGSRAAAVWGDGPEIGALLALRPAARGLRVAEVPSVAHAPVHRPADRPRLRHWLRATLHELRRTDRTTWAPPAPTRNVTYPGRRAPFNHETGAGRRALDRRAVESLAEGRRADERLARERTTVRQFTGAKGWSDTDRRHPSRRMPPVQPPFHRHDPRNSTPPPLPDGHPSRLGGPDTQPRSAQTPWRLAPGATQPVRREVGARRRRIHGLRQSQPTLKVINGEGTGTTGRRAQLRAVRKEDGQ